MARPAGADSAKGAVAPRIVVIGLDGASLNLLQPYAAQGVTPHIAALMTEGSRGHLTSIWPLRTPQVWTSIVTGKLPGQHGIWDHVTDSYFNPPEVRTAQARQVTSHDRRAAALWNLLDAKGLATLTVGWVSTWPAESLQHGAIVAPSEASEARQSSIKGSLWRNARDQVQPAALSPTVRPLIVEPPEVTAEEVAAFADLPPAGSALYKLPKLEAYAYTLRWSLARSKSVEAVTTALAAQLHPQVVLAYFECSDSLLHRFWIFQQSVADIRERLDGHGIASGQAEELKRRFGGVVQACYRDLDARVGRLLEALRGPDTLVLVVSDHGFGEATKPHRMKDEPYSGDHLDEGVLIAAGPHVVRGGWLSEASVLDITPTILAVLKQPVADDMRGKVLNSLFEPGAQPATARIPSYEAKPQTAAPYPEGYPPRKVPPRPTAAQMPK